jgi:hypothetical protein
MKEKLKNEERKLIKVFLHVKKTLFLLENWIQLSNLSTHANLKTSLNADILTISKRSCEHQDVTCGTLEEG